MATGTVKWFNNAKGYGFILSESGGGDLFVHYSSIQMAGYKTLRAGQQVDFDVQEGPKGPHAINIRFAEGEEAEGEPAQGPQVAEEEAGEEAQREEAAGFGDDAVDPGP